MWVQRELDAKGSVREDQEGSCVESASSRGFFVGRRTLSGLYGSVGMCFTFSGLPSPKVS